MGVATTVFNISHASLAMTYPAVDNMKRVQDHVDFLLRILPEGTLFVKCVALPVVGMSIPYELSFLNPWFDDGTTFEEDYVRAFYNVDPPKGVPYIHQFNLFKGIRYKFPEGSDKAYING